MAKMFQTYTEQPDGHDCGTKILYCTKLAAKTAAFVAIYDNIMYSAPVGLRNKLIRAGVVGFPFVMAGASFASVVCAATNIRKKDDHLNYFIGGAVAGAVFTLRYGRLGGILGAAFFSGFAGVLLKDAWTYNYSLLDNYDSDPAQKCDLTLYIKPSNNDS